jgi:RluA family pseudouridine synthase
MRRWIVREGDGATADAIVRRAGGDAKAIAEGRVFLGRKRVIAPDAPVAVGDEVTIAPPADAAPDVVILARESDFVAVDKPAGLPTIADHAGASHALVARAAAALGVDPGALHPTSRLDREVSGVVVFARTKQAAERFASARASHAYVRRYVAIASAAPSPEAGTWDAPIGRARDPRHRAVNGKEAVAARTHYATVATAGGHGLLALGPVTGRTHQLRVHASHAGAPLLGDRVYGGSARLTLASGRVVALDRVALHAARVTVPRARGGPLTIVSPIPEALAELWLSLGGAPSAWDTAVTCPLANA